VKYLVEGCFSSSSLLVAWRWRAGVRSLPL